MLINLFKSGLSGMALFAVLIAYILALLFSLTIHEFAHAFVAYKEGDDTAKLMGRMTLNPLAHLDIVGGILLLLVGFGWAKPVPTNPLKYKKFKTGIIKVSLAGVITNILVAIIFTFFFALTTKYCDNSITIQFFLSNFCYYMCVISFVLGIFNLLPIPPLDGYSVLKYTTKPNNKFIAFMEKYAFIFLIIILVTPLFTYLINFLFSLLINPLLSLWSIIIY